MTVATEKSLKIGRVIAPEERIDAQSICDCGCENANYNHKDGHNAVEARRSGGGFAESEGLGW